MTLRTARWLLLLVALAAASYFWLGSGPLSIDGYWRGTIGTARVEFVITGTGASLQGAGVLHVAGSNPRPIRLRGQLTGRTAAVWMQASDVSGVALLALDDDRLSGFAHGEKGGVTGQAVITRHDATSLETMPSPLATSSDMAPRDSVASSASRQVAR
jgi:hypothetical protein